ncbi:DUF192 domain-containing protein [Aliiroseovarius sediminis]|uniref:DUF192 domain-containing protein n=1 Tax=Aliiroseovarius sediminis TaxID=2925839 RepID=UPI002107722C|nr:DUF192 domain-containing protein [Aliiroseovarius sediminis]
MVPTVRKLARSGASVACALLLSGAVAWAGGCASDHVDLRGTWGQARFTVEIADDDSERARGLMHRETMPATHGMLFLYDRPREVSFWMKNTLIPLDMLFLRADGTVARIHHNAVPHDLTPIPGGTDILAVLEVNGGIAKRFGIDAGSVLRHPALDQDRAAWPCVAPD